MECGPPNTAPATCAMTVRCGVCEQSLTPASRQLLVIGSVMCTFVIRASAVRPANIDTAMAPIATSVSCAFFAFGSLNAGTPLAMASTPVSAVQPEANARNAKNISARNPREP